MGSFTSVYFSVVLLAVVAAASQMVLKLHDFSSLDWGTILSVFLAMVQNLHRPPWPLVSCSLPLGYFMLKVWKLFFTPLQLQRKLHEIGYMSEENLSLKDIANEYRKRRKCGEIPPVYPNGWFRVIDSYDLAVGDVKYISMLGEHLAVIRGTDGVVYIVNAHCPHQGANLGIGGQVVGNCLQCPFHGWPYRGKDGKCAEVPYCEKSPEYAKTKAWSCLEKNCNIYIWYHAEEIEPTWMPDEIKEIENGIWTYRGYTEHTINAHIEEIPENGSDINHLHHLHGPPIASGSDLRYSFSSWWQFAKHKWSAKWKPLENDEKHVGYLKLMHVFSIFGYTIPYTDLHITARQTGPGLVFMKWSSIFGDGIFLQSVTPKEPLLQTMRHSMYAAWTVPTFAAKLLLYAEALQVERDIMIWNHKTYVSRPLLVKEDHLIKKHRRWYSQFYSENSPRLSIKNTLVIS